ncbi:MAG: hypothetical protein ACREN2_03595 [Candidatus Dormibacteria bacterium]
MAFDADSLQLLHNWPAGGDPVAISVAGGEVWIANGAGDRSHGVQDANTVLEMRANDGAIVHTYAMPNPGDVLAGSDGTAIAISEETESGPASAFQLRSGSASQIGTALGTRLTLDGKQMARAGDSVYVLLGSGSGLSLQRLASDGFAAIAQLPLARGALACGGNACYVALGNADHGGVFRIDLDTGRTQGPWGGRYPQDVSVGGGNVWVVTPGPAVRAIDATTGGYASNAVALSGAGTDGQELASDAMDVWAVSNRQLVRITAH